MSTLTFLIHYIHVIDISLDHQFSRLLISWPWLISQLLVSMVSRRGESARVSRSRETAGGNEP